jgi:hypothetical protein
MTFDVEAAKPAVQAEAEAEPLRPAAQDAPPAALPAPSDPTKPEGGKPKLRRVK